MKNKAIIVVLLSLLIFSLATSSHAITITGTETITTNSSASYSAAGCNGTVTWNVTGTGASISSSGVLTTGSASCGGITVTARCSDGSTATKTARVTNAGQWVQTGQTIHCTGHDCTASTCIGLLSGDTKEVERVYGGGVAPCNDPCPPWPSGLCGFSSGEPTCYYRVCTTTFKWQCPSCTNGQTISCYTGPAGTDKVGGECKAGTQTCVNGQWGACAGEVLTQAEICGNDKDENCDGNINEGCETCEVSVKVSQTIVWPQKTGGKTEADVVATLSKPAPSGGCNINFTVEPVTHSGGHNHHDADRPKGTIAPSNISFSEGDVGSNSAKYKSSEVAGEEKIKVKVNNKDTSETIIQVKVPGFFELGEGDGYALIGQTATHHGNHYGTESTLYSLLDLAGAYYEENKGTLRINDISLIGGGLFDIKANWSSPHKSHRVGKNVDVDDVTAEGKKVRSASLKKVAEKLGIKITILDEGNHLHLSFP